jgi:hypothetical protein
MTGGQPLTGTICNALLGTAQGLVRDQQRARAIEGDGYDGLVTTCFRRATLEFIAGYEFEARLETDLGSTEVRFVVRDGDLHDLDRLRWYLHTGEGPPLPIDKFDN